MESFASEGQFLIPNNAYASHWRSTEICSANPPFFHLAKVLTTSALQGAKVVLCSPDWGLTGEDTYCVNWRRLWNHMTLGKTEFPDSPIHVSEHCDDTTPAPDWGTFLSIADGPLNYLPISDLHHGALKQLMSHNRGLSLLELKKRSTYPSAHSILKQKC